MTQAGTILLAEIRGEFQSADFDSSRTLTLLRGRLAELNLPEQRPDITEGERSEARELVLSFMRQVPQELLTARDRMMLQSGGRVTFATDPKELRPALRPVDRDEATQPARERRLVRVLKGAEALGKPVDDLSNRQKRLLAAVTDLPEPFPTMREHKEGTQLSRHLVALRQRLDWLVRLEEEHGDGQRGVHQNRAERNALIWVLAEQAERAGAEAARPAAPAPGSKYERRYIEMVEDLAREAIEDGYVVTDIAKPCILAHRKGEDIAPIDVPVGVWFAVRGYMRARPDGV